MKKAAFKIGEKITWHPEGDTQKGPESGIIELCTQWSKSFHYLIENKQPHCWVLEEWITGWEDRRRLRDKLDTAPPLPLKKAGNAQN